MRIPGVRKVVFEQRWDPPWSSNNLTAEGRKKLGL
jgi:metal-sulfur cluster biosynthetic enzyme